MQKKLLEQIRIEQSLIRKKNTKSLKKKSETVIYQPKTFKSTNIFDIKSVITEYPKTSNKLSKAGKLSSNSSGYSGAKQ